MPSDNQKTIIMKTKEILFILSQKGGVGKSVLAYQMANKILLLDVQSRVCFFDMDNENKSSLGRIRFLPCQEFNLTDTETKSIDRTQFDRLISGFCGDDKLDSLICDFGSTASDQFKKYLMTKTGLGLLSYYIQEKGLSVKFLCVVGGGDVFESSYNFAAEIFGQAAKIKGVEPCLMYNRYFKLTDLQTGRINDLYGYYRAGYYPYGLLMEESSGMGLEEVKMLMEEGISPLQSNNMVTLFRYRFSLDMMNFPLDILNR